MQPSNDQTSSEDTRHWIVCSGNVLKEVKAEQTVSKSVTECGEDLYEKQQQCNIHNNNAEEAETKVSLINSSASGLPLTQSRQLETDEDVHTFTCDTCGTSFIGIGSLQVHTSSHRRVNMYTCQLCTAWPASQCERNVPDKIRTRVKHFACSTCGKSFARVGYLREHERMHSGERPFSCTICGMSYARAGSLRDHERIHSGMKPFTCTLCGKSFIRVGHLRYHERTHSGVKPFTCSLCGKSFSQMGSTRDNIQVWNHWHVHFEKSPSHWWETKYATSEYVHVFIYTLRKLIDTLLRCLCRGLHIIQSTCFTCSESVAQTDRAEVCRTAHRPTVTRTMSFSFTTRGKPLSLLIPKSVEEYNLCYLCKLISRRSRIFLRGRPLSCEVPSRRDSVRGGGSSRKFPWSPKSDAVQWGGVVA